MSQKNTIRTLLTTLVVLVGLAACGGGEKVDVTTNEAGYKTVQAIDMTLQWKIEGDTIEIIAEAPTTGWVGVGFDPEEFMRGANFILGYVQDGRVTIEDHYGDKLTNHAIDTDLGGSEDVTVIGGSEEAGTTTIHFSIPLDSGDDYDKALSAGSTHKVLLAFGTSDDFTSEHSNTHRTSLELEL